jgi:hypothetical protein
LLLLAATGRPAESWDTAGRDRPAAPATALVGGPGSEAGFAQALHFRLSGFPVGEHPLDLHAPDMTKTVADSAGLDPEALEVLLFHLGQQFLG